MKFDFDVCKMYPRLAYILDFLQKENYPLYISYPSSKNYEMDIEYIKNSFPNLNIVSNIDDAIIFVELDRPPYHSLIGKEPLTIYNENLTFDISENYVENVKKMMDRANISKFHFDFFYELSLKFAKLAKTKPDLTTILLTINYLNLEKYAKQ